MEATNREAVGNNPPPILNPQTDQAALDLIRTETVISRLPIHNLAKKGNVNIQIIQTTPDGKVGLKWIVSYSDRYGQARQLAYKLDTIVINHHIDEQGRPLPKMICLGSLRDVADELDLGGDTNKVRRALRQNASAFITAKFEYRGNDGTRRTLEADFTRYSVIFTGEQLPDGTRADAVYIILNEPYREVLNNAPVRPLDRAYMKQLPPAAQRFYEIISRKIFAALKNNYPFAKLSYSEYCTYSAQLRHFERQPIQDQMAKILRPHKNSGYIVSVKYESTIDAQNKPDWIMHYTPGPKARAEFAAVHRGQKIKTVELGPAAAGETETERPKHTRTVSPQRKIRLPLQPQLAISQEFISELSRRGVSESSARKELANLPADFPVLDTLEYGDFQIDHSRGKIDNPQGFYISLLRDKIIPPPTFETAAKRLAREAAEREAERRRQEAWEAEQDRLAAEEQTEEQKLDDLQAGNPDRYQAIYRQCEDDLYREFPSMQRFGKPDSSLHVGSIRARMKRLLREQPAPEQGSDPISFLKPVAVLASATLAPGDATPETTPPVTEQPAADQQLEATASDPLAAEDGGGAALSTEPIDRPEEPLVETTPMAESSPPTTSETTSTSATPQDTNEGSAPGNAPQPVPVAIAPVIEPTPDLLKHEQGSGSIEPYLL